MNNVAYKTNRVNNLSPMPMLPRSAPIAATLTEEDISRGWRVECVTTNDGIIFQGGGIVVIVR